MKKARLQRVNDTPRGASHRARSWRPRELISPPIQNVEIPQTDNASAVELRNEKSTVLDGLVHDSMVSNRAEYGHHRSAAPGEYIRPGFVLVVATLEGKFRVLCGWSNHTG